MSLISPVQNFLQRKQRLLGREVPNWALVASVGGIALLVVLRARKSSGSVTTVIPANVPPTIASYLTAQNLPPVDYLFMDTLYPPNSTKAIELFTMAARQANLPPEWGSAPGLHSILAKESGGYVGRPNYQFGALANIKNMAEWPKVWKAVADGDLAWRQVLAEPFRSAARGTQSSATGLGQLTSTNIRTGQFYPSGVRGIGNALEEAIGMLKYIKSRYGDPAKAWASYGVGKEGY